MKHLIRTLYHIKLKKAFHTRTPIMNCQLGVIRTQPIGLARLDNSITFEAGAARCSGEILIHSQDDGWMEQHPNGLSAYVTWLFNPRIGFASFTLLLEVRAVSLLHDDY